jgi:hypothetical protein
MKRQARRRALKTGAPEGHAGAAPRLITVRRVVAGDTGSG